MSAQPKLSVCVPVYKGAAFLEDTLGSLEAQTYENFEVLISLDPSDDDDGSWGMIEDFKNRFRNTHIWRQSERLGWVENCNFLMRKCQSDFVSILPQDDLIPNYYFNILVPYIADRAKVWNVYPKMIAFGSQNIDMQQADIKGDLYERVSAVLRNHSMAISSLRGVQRNGDYADANLLDTRLPGGVAADTLQIMQHAAHGELHCLRTVLYRKRYHRHNTHANWGANSLVVQLEAWAALCAGLFAVAAKGLSRKQQLDLIQIAISRALGRLAITGSIPPEVYANENNQRHILEQFNRYLGIYGMPQRVNL